MMIMYINPPTASPSMCYPRYQRLCSLLRLSKDQRQRRGMSVVTHGAPRTSTYIFALVLPLSLLSATVFTAIRIDDNLETDFLREVSINQAIMEEDEDGGEAIMPLEKKPALPHRNRPKREAETSTM